MLTLDEALQFLAAHQPMPSSLTSPDAPFLRYSEVRDFFEEHPDPRCIPLFLGSFGEGDGHGTYQLVEDVIGHFESDQVVPHLCTALDTGNSANRFWVAQIAADFPSELLIPSLVKCLQDEDDGVRYMTVACLDQIQGERSRDVLLKHRSVESDEEVRDLIDEMLVAED